MNGDIKHSPQAWGTVAAILMWINGLILGVSLGMYLPSASRFEETRHQLPANVLPERTSCRYFDTLMSIGHLRPAPFGVRAIVDHDYDPYMGASYPVPGGRMTWNVWVLDDAHLGAVGRVDRTDLCRWYAAR